MLGVEELGQPIKIEPPDRVGQELARDEGPCLPVAQELPPGDLRSAGLWRIAEDVGPFRLPEAFLALGAFVEDEPEGQPDEAERRGGHERGRPAEGHRQPRDHGGRQDGAEVRAGIEQARGQGALLFREPFGHGLDGRGEVAGFGPAQGGPGRAEPGDGAGQGVRSRGQAPENDGGRVAPPRPKAVDDPAEEDQSQGVGRLEGGDDGAVLDLVPADLGLEQRREEAEDLPVDVVDGRRKEEQGADRPADAPDRILIHSPAAGIPAIVAFPRYFPDAQLRAAPLHI